MRAHSTHTPTNTHSHTRVAGSRNPTRLVLQKNVCTTRNRNTNYRESLSERPPSASGRRRSTTRGSSSTNLPPRSCENQANRERRRATRVHPNIPPELSFRAQPHHPWRVWLMLSPTRQVVEEHLVSTEHMQAKNTKL